MPPDTLHALVMDMPTLGSEQDRDPTITIAAILACQIDDGCRQGILIGSFYGLISLRPPRFIENTVTGARP